MHFDVIVVGAGPSGSTVASGVAKAGFKVLMVDKRFKVGEPVQCAGYIPLALTREVKVEEFSIGNKVNTLKFYAPSGKIYEFNAPGYVLHRALFDKNLALEAINAGAKLMLGTTFVLFKDKEVILKKGKKEFTFRARIIVGADGPLSTVGKFVNQENKEFVVAYQEELPLTSYMASTEVYYDKDLFGGYAWLFPKDSSANVGLGIKRNKNNAHCLKGLFEKFLERLLKEKKVLPFSLRKTGGLIPVGGPLKTVNNNVLLVGDAAGQTHPITGAGIPQAIICGKIAAEAIVRALKDDDLEKLKDYEVMWYKIFGDELIRAGQRRHKMEAEWESLPLNFKKFWVSFSEYYE